MAQWVIASSDNIKTIILIHFINRHQVFEKVHALE